ncbi:DUF1403 family protein [Azospirillum sp. TSA2s]|uniref:DUF1403 family protein n=1 Tax=Azospirillum sp. TSA2s TaxID=709810 RepID=UPI0010A9B80A|nr:DUF1403 family protein [Azospirillum sp. TSA2s]QCG94476.1 DUF1403 family protein [Azospirillum sp. TSA2s]
MSTSLRPLGPLLGAVARSAAALERLTPLLRTDPPWRRAWLDRLAVIETAGAASLHSGGPVLPDDVRDVDHAIATGPRARIIHGVRALWRVEAERRPLEVDLPLLLDALGRTVEVAPDRLVAARLTSGQGAAAAYIPNPVERAATLVAFAEDLEDLTGGLPALPAAAAVLGAWAERGCGPIATGCWIAARVLARRQRWTLTPPLLASGFLAHGTDYMPRIDNGDWVIALANAVERAVNRAIALFGSMERRFLALDTAPGARRADVLSAVRTLARGRDSFDAVDIARASGAPERTARRHLETLMTAGALQELTGRKSYRLYGL